MHNNKLVLQLNGPALERLIGGDTEVEVDLRQQIAENFAKKHLKAIANAEGFEERLTDFKVSLEAQFRAEAERQIGTLSTGWQPTLKLNEAFQEKLDKFVREYIDKELWEVFKRYIEERTQSLLLAAEGFIQKALEKNIEKRINDEIARRLSVAAQTK